MLTRPQAFGTGAVLKLPAISTAEGVAHLRSEFVAGVPQAEVLIASDAHRVDKIAVEHAERTRAAAQPARSVRPLVEKLVRRSAAEVVTHVTLDPLRDPFLALHRLRGRPIVPLVAAMELLAEAADALRTGTGGATVWEGVEIVNPFLFHTDQPVEARVVAERAGSMVRCELRADFHNRAGELVGRDRLYARSVLYFDSVPAPPQLDVTRLPATWEPVVYPESEAALFHGPAFRTLKHFAAGQGADWGLIEPSPPEALAGARSSTGWLVPLSALDGCLFCCGISVWHATRQFSAPTGIERVTLWRPPTASDSRLIVECLCTSAGLFDFNLYTAAGEPLLSATALNRAAVPVRPSATR